MKKLKLNPDSPKLMIKRIQQFIIPASVALFLATIVASSMVSTPENIKVDEAASHQNRKILSSQVDTANGAPRGGRDPSTQRQTGLAEAASSPTGAGQRVDKPAAGVTGHHDHHHSHADVFGDPSKTGIGSNGCYINYGKPGEQCLPAHAASNRKLTCKDVKKYFKSGVEVNGRDRFNLDKNGDGVACNRGD